MRCSHLEQASSWAPALVEGWSLVSRLELSRKLAGSACGSSARQATGKSSAGLTLFLSHDKPRGQTGIDDERWANVPVGTGRLTARRGPLTNKQAGPWPIAMIDPPKVLLTFSDHELALLRGVAVGRARISRGYEPDLFIGGLASCDESPAHHFVHFGLVKPAKMVARSQWLPSGSLRSACRSSLASQRASATRRRLAGLFLTAHCATGVNPCPTTHGVSAARRARSDLAAWLADCEAPPATGQWTSSTNLTAGSR